MKEIFKWYLDPKGFVGFDIRENGKPNEYDIFAQIHNCPNRFIKIGRMIRQYMLFPFLFGGNIFLFLSNVFLFMNTNEPMIILFCTWMMLLMVICMFCYAMVINFDKKVSTSCNRCR